MYTELAIPTSHPDFPGLQVYGGYDIWYSAKFNHANGHIVLATSTAYLTDTYIYCNLDVDLVNKTVEAIPVQRTNMQQIQPDVFRSIDGHFLPFEPGIMVGVTPVRMWSILGQEWFSWQNQNYPVFPTFYDKTSETMVNTIGALTFMAEVAWDGSTRTVKRGGGSNSVDENYAFGKDTAETYWPRNRAGHYTFYRNDTIENIMNETAFTGVLESFITSYGYVPGVGQTTTFDNAYTTAFNAQENNMFYGRGEAKYDRMTMVDYTNDHPNLIVMWEDTIFNGGESNWGVCYNRQSGYHFPLDSLYGYIGP